MSGSLNILSYPARLAEWARDAALKPIRYPMRDYKHAKATRLQFYNMRNAYEAEDHELFCILVKESVKISAPEETPAWMEIGPGGNDLDNWLQEQGQKLPGLDDFSTAEFMARLEELEKSR